MNKLFEYFKLFTRELYFHFLFPVKCGNDWVQYKQRCVKYFNQKVKFQEAEKICESNNVALISIHSAEENEFIRNYIEEQPSLTRVWIGLKRSPDSHNFVWVDKSLVDYVNWLYRQPDNAEGLELYIEMWIDGTWNDRNDDNITFVCGSNCKLSIKFQNK